MPPLYRLHQGKKAYYAYDDNERDLIMERMKKDNKTTKIGLQRYKGLGEMNPEQLWDTTMDPEKRKLLRVQFDHENYEEASKMFDVLMGDVVEPRKRFIEDNALNVQNLDV